MVKESFDRWFDKLVNSWWLRKASNLQLPIADARLRPFFIVSSGRSGTTLLRKKLMNSDYVHIPPESDDFIPYNAVRFIKKNAEGWNRLIENLLENFQRQPFYKYWAAEMEGLQQAMECLPPDRRSYASLIDALYVHVSKQHKPHVQVWGDKTPYLVYRLEWLRLVFPNARYIHLVRDGRAVVHSMVKKQNYGLEKALIRWKDSIDLFADHCRHVSTDAVLEIRYEDFVNFPEHTLEKVCNFIGVGFHDSVLHDRKVVLGDDVLPHHGDLHKPMTIASIGKWRNEMSAREVKWINGKVGRELARFGYEV